jgi:putative membrane protein insertion efficiency factor
VTPAPPSLRLPEALPPVVGRPARSRAAGGLISAIRGYQLLRAGRPSGCRFLPSCSEYAIGAVEAHGAVRGTGLAARRLLRCHPFGGQGVDPVPVPGEGAPCSH